MSPIRRLGTVLLSAALTAQLLTACAPGNAAPGGVEGPRWEDLEYDHSLELQYAQQFSVDYYQGGYALVEIRETGTYLVVPPEADVPSGLDEGVTVLQQPLDRIYLAATSAMDLFRELDGLDAIRLSGTEAQGWYVEEARAALYRQQAEQMARESRDQERQQEKEEAYADSDQGGPGPGENSPRGGGAGHREPEKRHQPDGGGGLSLYRAPVR